MHFLEKECQRKFTVDPITVKPGGGKSLLN